MSQQQEPKRVKRREGQKPTKYSEVATESKLLSLDYLDVRQLSQMRQVDKESRRLVDTYVQRLEQRDPARWCEIQATNPMHGAACLKDGRIAGQRGSTNCDHACWHHLEQWLYEWLTTVCRHNELRMAEDVEHISLTLSLYQYETELDALLPRRKNGLSVGISPGGERDDPSFRITIHDHHRPDLVVLEGRWLDTLTRALRNVREWRQMGGDLPPNSLVQVHCTFGLQLHDDERLRERQYEQEERALEMFVWPFEGWYKMNNISLHRLSYGVLNVSYDRFLHLGDDARFLRKCERAETRHPGMAGPVPPPVPPSDADSID
jgi:hypothetical protein